MSRDLIDRTGSTYGRWTVLGRASWSLSGASTWHVMCQCGETAVRAGSELKSLAMCPECHAWKRVEYPSDHA
jgi:hypothetical protein